LYQVAGHKAQAIGSHYFQLQGMLGVGQLKYKKRIEATLNVQSWQLDCFAALAINPQFYFHVRLAGLCIGQLVLYPPYYGHAGTAKALLPAWLRCI
jgi:hypothetical protein